MPTEELFMLTPELFISTPEPEVSAENDEEMWNPLMTKADVVQQSNNDAISKNNEANSKSFTVADSDLSGSIS